MKYEFHVGDYVETSGGHEGYILKYNCFSDEFPAVWFLTVYHKEYGHSTVYEVREHCFLHFSTASASMISPRKTMARLNHWLVKL